jgi:ferrous-iron efflux pump FieF
MISKKDTLKNQENLMQLATYASMSVALILIIVKIWAWYDSRSLSILSSLLDSIIDFVASFITMIAVKHSLRPADDNRKFGYGKVESIASLGQAIFIFTSSLFIFYEIANRVYTGEYKTIISFDTIAVMVFASIMTIILVSFQNYVIKKTNSIAIKADSIHYFSDLLVNLGVLAALIITMITNLFWVDCIFGGLIGLYMIKSGIYVAKISIEQLIDSELPPEDVEKIHNIITTQDKVIAVHDLKTRMSGRKAFIQFDIELDSKMTLLNAHEIAVQVEIAILKEFPNSDVMIHLDPYGHPHDYRNLLHYNKK